MADRLLRRAPARVVAAVAMLMTVSTGCLVTDTVELYEAPDAAVVEHRPRIVNTTPVHWVVIKPPHAGDGCVQDLELTRVDYGEIDGELWARLFLDYDPKSELVYTLTEQEVAATGDLRRIGPKFTVPLKALGAGVHTAVALVSEKRGAKPDPATTGWDSVTWVIDLSEADSTNCAGGSL